MRDGAPSRTAQHVAAYRLGFERLPAPFGDSESDERLARDLLAELDFEPEERMAGYLRVRTSFFDRVVLNALNRGTTQVAAIGAGYDGRALRYAKPGVRWFEVDHPVTQPISVSVCSGLRSRHRTWRSSPLISSRTMSPLR